METESVVKIVKETVGIRSSTARDEYITALVNGVIAELKDEQGIKLDLDKPNHLFFVCDFSAWRYEHSKEPLPRDLQFRLHNLIISSPKGETNA